MFLFFIPGKLPIWMVITIAEPHHLMFKYLALWPPPFSNFSSTYWYLEPCNLTGTFWPLDSMPFSLSFILLLRPYIPSFMGQSWSSITIIPLLYFQFLDLLSFCQNLWQNPQTWLKLTAPIQFLHPSCGIWLGKHNHTDYS